MVSIEDLKGWIKDLRWYQWIGYGVWSITLALLLSFSWGSLMDDEPRAAMIGGILFVFTVEIGLGVQMIYKYMRGRRAQGAKSI